MTLVAQALPWMAVVMLALALFAALALLTARSLFAVSMALAAVSACLAGALAALGYGDAALALGFVGVCIAPVLLLGGVLLSARSVKPRKRAWPWASIAAAGAAATAMLWAAPMLDVSAPIVASRSGGPVALAALVFVAVAACVALLGYGERGILGGRREGDV